MPVARINDLNIRYEIQGLGEPLLLIMGYRGSGYMWGDELLAPLSRYFQVITFDNRGTGGSDKPNSVYTLPMMAGDAAGLLRHLGISRAHVFGVSMGGMIAQELALHYPRQIDRLILGCTNCGGPHAVLAPMHVLETLLVPPDMPREEAIRRQWPVMFSPDFVKHNPDVLDRLTARSLEHPTPLYSAIRQAMAVQRFNTYGRLGQIVAPTLVVAGSADQIVPYENSFLLAHRIHRATLEILPGAGHAFFWEQPSEVVELLSEFCYGSDRRDDFTEPFTAPTYR
jgi:pimeloyl-ACP methyl ester carboxylesterase